MFPVINLPDPSGFKNQMVVPCGHGSSYPAGRQLLQMSFSVSGGHSAILERSKRGNLLGPALKEAISASTEVDGLSLVPLWWFVQTWLSRGHLFRPAPTSVPGLSCWHSSQYLNKKKSVKILKFIVRVPQASPLGVHGCWHRFTFVWYVHLYISHVHTVAEIQALLSLLKQYTTVFIPFKSSA